MAETIITTPRLLLRTEADSDEDIWNAHINTPNIRKYLGGVETSENIRAAFDRVQESQTQNGFSFWFLEERSSGELLGCCGLKLVNAEHAPKEIHGMVEIGWILREEVWGQGYAGEAARASLQYGFAQGAAEQIVALTSESNIPSWKMMESLGMVRHDAWEFHDPDFPDSDNPTLVYAITRQQWNDIKKS